MKIFGVILIVAGIFALAYGGFTYTTHKRAVDVGPSTDRNEEQAPRLYSPVLGICGIILGGALLFVARTHTR